MVPIADRTDEESSKAVRPIHHATSQGERAIEDVLREMGRIYRLDPVKAVRGQGFISHLHRHIQSQLESRLTGFAKKRGIKVVLEAKVLGSTKPKDVDVSVIDPENGPLMLIGVRSQMSSVGKNILTYYEALVGECISLQDRFPMSTHAYIYLHPLKSIMEGRELETIDHQRYARMYAAVTGRAGPGYKGLRGVFDQFAYMIVDFDSSPPALRDDLLQGSLPGVDISIRTLVDRAIETFNERTLFWRVFE